eukprot:scaffold39015_cov72-Phaeocystis_antarctica.AAC.3
MNSTDLSRSHTDTRTRSHTHTAHTRTRAWLRTHAALAMRRDAVPERPLSTLYFYTPDVMPRNRPRHSRCDGKYPPPGPRS